VVTRSLPDERAPEVWDFLGKQIAAGHQAYVVYPVIEENEERELKAAEQMHRQLRDKIFPRLHVGLLHGRLDADEKERVMREFQQGKIEILVATTVIEVGVDVPNANVMVIEHADPLDWRSSTSCADASAAARRNPTVCSCAAERFRKKANADSTPWCARTTVSRSRNSTSNCAAPANFSDEAGGNSEISAWQTSSATVNCWKPPNARLRW